MANPLDTVIATLQNGVTAINEIDSTVSVISTTLDSINTTLGSINTTLIAMAASATPWIAYTPTITSGAGSFTTVSAAGRYKRMGSVVFVTITITITTNNTAATSVIATLPISAPTAPVYAMSGRGSVSGKQLQGTINPAASVTIFNYDGTYPGADGETLLVSGLYEVT